MSSHDRGQKVSASPAPIATALDAEPRTERSDPAAAGHVTARLRALKQMDCAALREEWRRLYRVQPPNRVGRDLLMLGVAWKIQEQVYGGLSAAIKRRLVELATTLEQDGDVRRGRITLLRAGAKLVREWRGETHTVTVQEDGFEWQGRRWRSLSVIAREITRGHWSGPRFFGLLANPTRQARGGRQRNGHANGV
jgi:hypothetical protein